ncbi:MAG: 5-formyltetrahydrofolate cyclo-ligase [Gammaproteobacteria bacterium]
MRDLRSKLKRKRLMLTRDQIRNASSRITNLLWGMPELGRSRRLAVYMAINGEPDCDSLTQDAWLRKYAVFAPVLRGRRLKFAPLKQDSRLQVNRFGIFEPESTPQQLLRPNDLDVVIVPLLAFDSHGNRLGMGAGYYDRSFSFLKARNKWLHPKLIGVAYDFQRVRRIDVQPWDVPLNVVVTESKVYRFR